MSKGWCNSMGRTLENLAAEKEANDIAFKFANSSDVIKDMSEAYNVDFSNIRLHSDDSSDAKVKSAGKDAIASGNDIFFGKGILESNDSASKGLLAHELAHTMQQGVVESSGVVSESVSEGAEQGGIRDWFRSLFNKGPKISEPKNGQKMQDQASIQYMRMMKEKESKLTKDKMDQISVMAVNNSNATYQKSLSEGKDVNTAVIQALVDFGHRSTSTEVGRFDRDTRKKVFNGSSQMYRKYMENKDAHGMDFASVQNGMKMYGDEIASFKDKKYMYGNGLNSMVGDMVDIVGSMLSTDDGMEYVSNMYNGIKDADVFKTGKVTPMSYILQTAFTGEGIKMMGSMREGKYSDREGQGDARNEVINQITRSLMNLPSIDRMSDEQRNLLPPETKTLYAKYVALQKQLEQQVTKYYR